MALLCRPTVASYGYRPVYAPAAAGVADPVGQLAAVRIAPLKDSSQQLHKVLRDELNLKRQPINPGLVLRPAVYFSTA